MQHTNHLPFYSPKHVTFANLAKELTPLTYLSPTRKTFYFQRRFLWLILSLIISSIHRLLYFVLFFKRTLFPMRIFHKLPSLIYIHLEENGLDLLLFHTRVGNNFWRKEHASYLFLHKRHMQCYIKTRNVTYLLMLQIYIITIFIYM